MSTRTRRGLAATALALALAGGLLAPAPAGAQQSRSGGGTNQPAVTRTSFAEVPEPAHRLAVGLLWANDVRCTGWTVRQAQGWAWLHSNATTCSSARLRQRVTVHSQTTGVLFNLEGVATATRSDGFRALAQFAKWGSGPLQFTAAYGR